MPNSEACATRSALSQNPLGRKAEAKVTCPHEPHTFYQVQLALRAETVPFHPVASRSLANVEKFVSLLHLLPSSHEAQPSHQSNSIKIEVRSGRCSAQNLAMAPSHSG